MSTAPLDPSPLPASGSCDRCGADGVPITFRTDYRRGGPAGLCEPCRAGLGFAPCPAPGPGRNAPLESQLAGEIAVHREAACQAAAERDCERLRGDLATAVHQKWAERDELVERRAECDRLRAELAAAADRETRLLAGLAEQKAANLALADRLAASAALTQAAERRPNPLAELAAWEWVTWLREATLRSHHGRWRLTLDDHTRRPGRDEHHTVLLRVDARQGSVDLPRPAETWHYESRSKAAREFDPAQHDPRWADWRTLNVDVLDASDPAAVIAAALAKWAESEQPGGAP